MIGVRDDNNLQMYLGRGKSLTLASIALEAWQ